MFTKDECLLALKGLRALERAENFEKWNGQVAPQIKCDVMESLINKHFDEKGDVKVFAKIVFDEDKMKKLVNKVKEQIDEVIEEIINPKPYKFEDLKVGMWIWDSKENKCNKIIEIDKDTIGFYYVMDNVTRFTCQFEENRFYSVQMANEVKENE